MGRDNHACWGGAGLVVAVALNVRIRPDYLAAVAVLSGVALYAVGCFYDNAGTLADSMK